MRRRSIGWCLVIALVALPAAAEERSPEEQAEELFRQAKALMAEGRHAEACPLLADSHSLDPGGGTLLALAICYEKEGKLATAFNTFRSAATKAREDGRADREAIAEKRIAAIEPRLCRISVRFAPATMQLAGLSAVLDGRAVAAEELAIGITVDPGRHLLVVTADGRLPFERELVLEGEGTHEKVLVPSLASPEPTPPKPSPRKPARRSRRAVTPAPAAEESMSVTRIAGFVVGGAGLGALGVGSYFGIRAALDQSEADDICPDTSCTDAGAVELNQDAGDAADWATGTLVAGSVCVALGIVLVVAFPGSTNADATNGGRARAGPLSWRW